MTIAFQLSLADANTLRVTSLEDFDVCCEADIPLAAISMLTDGQTHAVNVLAQSTIKLEADLAAAVARAERAERGRDTLQSRVDALDVAAKSLPLGATFPPGFLPPGVPMFNVAQACTLYMRGERSILDYIVPVPAPTEDPNHG